MNKLKESFQSFWCNVKYLINRLHCGILSLRLLITFKTSVFSVMKEFRFRWCDLIKINILIVSLLTRLIIFSKHSRNCSIYSKYYKTNCDISNKLLFYMIYEHFPLLSSSFSVASVNILLNMFVGYRIL